MFDKNEIYKNALLVWGGRKQLVVAIEELSELQKVLCKHIRNNMKFDEKIKKDIIEEVADVEIMIEQIKYMFGIGTVIEKFKKLERLEERVNNELHNTNRAKR